MTILSLFGNLSTSYRIGYIIIDIGRTNVNSIIYFGLEIKTTMIYKYY